MNTKYLMKQGLSNAGKGAQTGAAIGGMLGTVLPGVGNVLGAAGGAVAGAGIGNAVTAYQMLTNPNGSTYQPQTAMFAKFGAELEKKETVLRPDQNLLSFNGPTHQQGGIKYSPKHNSEFVFSDSVGFNSQNKLTLDPINSFAKMSKKFDKRDPVSQNTLDMLKQDNKQFLRMFQAPQFGFRYGGTPKYPLGGPIDTMMGMASGTMGIVNNRLNQAAFYGIPYNQRVQDIQQDLQNNVPNHQPLFDSRIMMKGMNGQLPFTAPNRVNTGNPAMYSALQASTQGAVQANALNNATFNRIAPFPTTPLNQPAPSLPTANPANASVRPSFNTMQNAMLAAAGIVAPPKPAVNSVSTQSNSPIAPPNLVAPLNSAAPNFTAPINNGYRGTSPLGATLDFLNSNYGTNASALLKIPGTAYNMIKGMGKPEVDPLRLNRQMDNAINLMSDRKYDPEAAYQAISRQTNAARAMTQGNNPFLNIAQNQAITNSAQAAQAQANLQGQQMNNQYRAQEAATRSQLGSEERQIQRERDIANLQNKATRNSFLQQSFQDMSAIGDAINQGKVTAAQIEEAKAIISQKYPNVSINWEQINAKLDKGEKLTDVELTQLHMISQLYKSSTTDGNQ